MTDQKLFLTLADFSEKQQRFLRALSSWKFKSVRTVLRHAKLKSWPPKTPGGRALGKFVQRDAVGNIRLSEYGLAVCQAPQAFDEYYIPITSSK